MIRSFLINTNGWPVPPGDCKRPASHEFREMLPDFQGKRVLDLGCGFGWHCRYAVEQGAKSVVGVDLSAKMLREAREKTSNSKRRLIVVRRC